MTWRECELHVAGQSRFVDDLPVPDNTLHAAVVTSPVANGRLRAIRSAAARSQQGVAAIITASDIPGLNQIGDIVQDEVLLASDELKFIGKPVALVLAESPEQARAAASLVVVDCERHTPVLDLREAHRQGLTFGDERRFHKGDIDHAFASAAHTVTGSVATGAQEHLYFETQVALALPADGERIRLCCASQSPSTIQRFAASMLGVPMHAIEVEVPRLGGAFGGKEEQAKPWALLAALGAFVTGRPVKLVLSRREDLCWTGKRHPYSAHYQLAADARGKLLAYKVQFLQDGGAVADLSSAVLERTLFHASNAYAIPAIEASAISCRTHHPSNTAFRGFGAPQAVFTLEAAIDHLAQRLQRPRWQLQQNNLLAPGYRFDYGMKVTSDALEQCWQTLWQRGKLEKRMTAIDSANRASTRYRKGLALTPLCFGIAFTATHLNQASVTVNIYTDGSIGIATSAVEMGQGVTEKIRAIAARCLALPTRYIQVAYTNSSKAANMSPTAASVGTDLSGMATLQACTALKARLCQFAAAQLGVEASANRADETVPWHSDARQNEPDNRDQPSLSWETLVKAAYLARVSLSEHAFYATPDLYFDRAREQGQPFAYHVYGVSAIEATVDCLLGTYRIDTIDVAYDLGDSLAPLIDIGQLEGGLVQGVGYATLEEVRWDERGHLLTDSFATYKIPDMAGSPIINVELLASTGDNHGPFNAKAIGEPPLLLGLGAWLAIADAIRAANPEVQLDYQLPLTPEKVLLALESAGEYRPKGDD